MKQSFYRYLMISAVAVLLGCASSDTENQQSQSSQQPEASTMSGRKAYVDPATGELTSTPPSSGQKQEAQLTTPEEPVVFDQEVKEDGTIILIPRKPVTHEITAQFDCDGNLKIGHDQAPAQQSDCSAKQGKGGVQ